MEGAIASWYARITQRDRSYRALADAIAARVPRGARVLEVAPGPGYLAIELARRGFAVSAIDISKSFVRITVDNARTAGGRRRRPRRQRVAAAVRRWLVRLPGVPRGVQELR
jgi:ubiquinone/menaquinone biosynthesis C-methylase UbiE